MTTATMEQEIVQTLHISKAIDVDAPIDLAWQATLAELGPDNQMPDGTPFPFKLEPWPGGRWYRDLGNNAGHLWGHVQVIKPPALIEITGPMPMSFPAINHLQYRLKADGDRTHITLLHRAMGLITQQYLDGMPEGWEFTLKRIRETAERNAKKGTRS